MESIIRESKIVKHKKGIKAFLTVAGVVHVLYILYLVSFTMSSPVFINGGIPWLIPVFFVSFFTRAFSMSSILFEIPKPLDDYSNIVQGKNLRSTKYLELEKARIIFKRGVIGNIISFVCGTVNFIVTMYLENIGLLTFSSDFREDWVKKLSNFDLISLITVLMLIVLNWLLCREVTEEMLRSKEYFLLLSKVEVITCHFSMELVSKFKKGKVQLDRNFESKELEEALLRYLEDKDLSQEEKEQLLTAAKETSRQIIIMEIAKSSV